MTARVSAGLLLLLLLLPEWSLQHEDDPFGCFDEVTSGLIDALTLVVVSVEGGGVSGKSELERRERGERRKWMV